LRSLRQKIVTLLFDITLTKEIGDFNLEVIMAMYLKATVKSALAERILTQLATQLHPEVEYGLFVVK